MDLVCVDPASQSPACGDEVRGLHRGCQGRKWGATLLTCRESYFLGSHLAAKITSPKLLVQANGA